MATTFKKILVWSAACLAAVGAWATDYTWTGGAEGDGESWYNPTNWGKTAVGAYPRTTSDKAIVAANAVVSWTITNDVTVYAVTFGKDSQVTLRGVGETVPQLKLNSGFTDSGIKEFNIDHADFVRWADWTPASGSTITLTNGAKLQLNSFNMSSMTGVSLSGRSYMTVNEFRINGATPVLTIDDSTFITRSNTYFGTANPGGGRIVFKGAKPLFRNTNGAFRSGNNNVGMTNPVNFDFEVPLGGYVETPIQVANVQCFKDSGNVPAGKMSFNVLATSPALTAGTKLDALLLYSQLGIVRSKASAGTGGTTIHFTNTNGTAADSDSATKLFVTINPTSETDQPPAVVDSAVITDNSSSVARKTFTGVCWVRQLPNDGKTVRIVCEGGTVNDTATFTDGASVTPTAIGKVSVDWTAPEGWFHKTCYIRLRYETLDAGGTVVSTEYSPVMSQTTLDTTTYTWSGKGDGKSWNDSSNWSDNQGGNCMGYPQTTSGTARFITDAEVEIDQNYSLASLNLADASDINVRFKSADETRPQLTLSGLSMPAKGSVWTIDHVYVNRAAEQSMTSKSTIIVENGGYLYFNTFNVTATDALIEIREGSTNSVDQLRIGAKGSVVINNGYLNARSHVYLGYSSAGGSLIFKGTHPQLYSATADRVFDSNLASCNATLGFDIPAGGYESAPITCIASKSKTFFDTANSASITISVLGTSPALASSGSLTTTLVNWQKGYSSYLTYGLPPNAAAGSAFAIDGSELKVTVSGNSRTDRLTVVSAQGMPSPAVGDHDGYVKDAVSTLSAGATVSVSANERYVCTGWKKYAVNPATSEKTLVASGNTSSFEYTHSGEWTEVEWLWTRECLSAAGTSENGTATISGDWSAENAKLTATATPAAGYRFSYWSGDTVDVPILANPATFPSDRPRTLVANFVSEDTEVVLNTYTGASDGSWNTGSNWSLGHVPTAEEIARIPSGKKAVKITNAGVCSRLEIINDAGLQLLGSGDPVAEQIRLDVRTNVGSTGNSLTLGSGYETKYDVFFYAGGDVCISNNNRSAAFNVYAGDAFGTNSAAVITAANKDGSRTAAYLRGGTKVMIGGKLYLGGTSGSNATTLNIYSHAKTGMSPVFECGSIEITARGTVNGDGRGWMSYDSQYYGPGSSIGGGYGGASYGGRGGCAYEFDAYRAGLTYGSPYAPVYAGSDQGNHHDCGDGGSLFRCHVRGDFSFNGTISVNGTGAGSGNVRGGGSGGGVWITCATFTPGSSAKINAKGGGYTNASAWNGSGGGGGRVAIAVGCTDETDITAFAETGDCASYTRVDFTKSPWPTIVNVSGGRNNTADQFYPGQYPYVHGNPGTAYFLQKIAAGKAPLKIIGDPADLGEAEPVYLTHVVDVGDTLCSNSEIGYITGSGNRSRMHLTGYVWTNATTSASGSANSVTVPVNGETVLVWQFDDLEHQLLATSGGYGSVSAHDEWIDDGDEVTLTATPESGAVFVRWVGDVPAASRNNAVITLTMDQPRRVVAVFDKPGAEPREFSWNGTGDWLLPATWDGTAIPGTNDTVTVTGTAAISIACEVDVGHLVVSSGAKLAFDLTKDYDAKLHVAGDFEIANNAVVTLGALDRASRADLVVDGTLSLAGSGSIVAYAGEGAVENPGWQAFKAGGSSISAGDIVLDGTSSIFVHTSKSSGLPVVINVDGDVTVGATAQISGSYWTAANNSFGYGWKAPHGFGYSGDCGGSYGGPGGNAGVERTYGYKYAPFYPGSPGSQNLASDNGQGGGSVRIAAGGTVTLNGKIYVTGGHGNGSGNRTGAAGSVWITCAEFTAGDNAVINARGGRANQHSDCRAGGGGRVAIMIGSPSDDQLDALYATGTCDYLLVIAEDMGDAATSPFPTLVDVRGGENNDQSANLSYFSHGKPGTAVYLKNSYGQAIVTVQGEISSTEMSPAYGSGSVDMGEQTFSAPEYFYLDDGLSRRPCAGYTWEDGNGASGSGSTYTFTKNLDSDISITWLWGTVQHKLTTTSGGYGTISGGDDEWYADGSIVTLKANADDDCSFERWVGDFDYTGGVNLQSTLTVTMNRPREIVALFRGAASRTVVWNAASTDFDWFNKDNWDGIAVPSPIDSLSFTGGTFQVRFPYEMRFASWQQGKSTVGFVGTKTTTSSDGFNENTVTYVNPIDMDDTRLYSLKIDGGMTIADTAKLWFGGLNATSRHDVVVGGNLTLANKAQFELYAGWQGEAADWHTFVEGGAKLQVGGNFVITNTATFFPCSHIYTGAPVVISVGGTAAIADGASINANVRGYGRRFWNPGDGWRSYVYGPGARGHDVTDRYGGTYGGLGGRASGSWYPDGIGYLIAPYYPGSAGFITQSYTGDIFSGGGAVRLSAEMIVVNGKITANGDGEYCVAGGSGGGIWLTSRKFELGANGSVTANGGRCNNYGATGGGGGGRIAIALKFAPGQIERLYRTGTTRTGSITNLADMPEWTGHYSVNGGIGGDGTDYGAPGTAVFVVAPDAGTWLILK